eukprot:s1957_g26.t1
MSRPRAGWPYTGMGTRIFDPYLHHVLDFCEYPRFCVLAHFLRHTICSYASVSVLGDIIRVSPEAPIALRSKTTSIPEVEEGQFCRNLPCQTRKNMGSSSFFLISLIKELKD